MINMIVGELGRVPNAPVPLVPPEDSHNQSPPPVADISINPPHLVIRALKTSCRISHEDRT